MKYVKLTALSISIYLAWVTNHTVAIRPPGLTQETQTTQDIIIIQFRLASDLDGSQRTTDCKVHFKIQLQCMTQSMDSIVHLEITTSLLIQFPSSSIFIKKPICATNF